MKLSKYDISNSQIEIAKGIFFWSILGIALVIAAIAAILLLAATPYAVRLWSGIDAQVESIGTFGDQFGMTNALFSGLALAFVGITLLLQTLELRAQRKENDDTQAIMDQQQIQLKFQANAMKQQGFDYTFFQLESAFRAIRSTPISQNGQFLPELLSNHSRLVNDCSSYFRQAIFSDRHTAGNPYVKDGKKIKELLVQLGAKPSLKEQKEWICDDKTMRACAYGAYVNHRKNISEWMGPFFQVLETTLDLVDTLYVFPAKPMESIDTPENDIVKKDYAKAKK
ncbi:MAG: hypothetical protein AB8C13_09000 [Phycisphaerales bacterium]